MRAPRIEGTQGRDGEADQDDNARRLAAEALALIDRLVMVGAFSLVFLVFVFHLNASFDSGLFTGFSLVEEAAYTYTSARNYLEFGFGNTALLQDFASSADPLDHPYVYNHMPAGPDIIIALLMKFTGGDYAAVRTVLGLGALIGFAAFFSFARALLVRHGLRFAGLAIVVLGAWTIVNFMERQIYAFYLLLAFLPLLAFDKYLRSGNSWYFAGACAVALPATFYIEYSALSGLAFCWFFLFATQLLPMRFWHLFVIGCVFATGIGLHLLQNMYYLGPEIFFEELRLTLSNRITGKPSQEEMSAFYRAIGVVHHGSHPIALPAIWAQLKSNLYIAGWPAWLGVLVCSLTLCCIGTGPRYASASRFREADFDGLRKTAWIIVRFAVWIIGTIWGPIFLFPAFAQEVNLRGFGANLLFLGIGLAAAASLAAEFLCRGAVRIIAAYRQAQQSGYFRRAVSSWLANPAKSWLDWVRLTALAGLAVFFFQAASMVGLQTVAQLRQVAQIATSATPTWRDLEQIRAFDGGLFMTNINVPLVGLLTRAPGFGVCEPRSIGEDGSIEFDACKVGFMRRVAYWQEQRPRYFFYFSDRRLFPGFADCMPAQTITAQNRLSADCMTELRDKLSNHYHRVHVNSAVEVFDLTTKKVGG